MPEQENNPPPITYLVGPNGTGKTRYLRDTITPKEHALFVPKNRQERGLAAEFPDNEEFVRYRERFESSPEQVAFRLLRESVALRLEVFAILSRKLDRNLSLNIVERSTTCTIRSVIGQRRIRKATIPTYSIEQESKMTNITNFTGRVERGDLVLKGAWYSDVARLIEGG